MSRSRDRDSDRLFARNETSIVIPGVSFGCLLGARKHTAMRGRMGMKTIKRRKSTKRSQPGAGVALLESYCRTRRVSVRDQLVERYRPYVEVVARKLAARLPRSVDEQDLVHAGIWGLLQAIENFEPERGRGFVPFMRWRVRGAMMDELRAMDYLPRLYRQRLRQLEDARERLQNELAREPSDAELADALGVSEAVMRRSYVVPTQAPLRAADGDESEEGLEWLADDVESPIEALDRQELLEKIEASLQPIEWKVLRMHYLEGKSGKDVARELRLSASRICQIHMRVLSRLKARLAGKV